jgi:hypothetical protein
METCTEAYHQIVWLQLRRLAEFHARVVKRLSKKGAQSAPWILRLMMTYRPEPIIPPGSFIEPELLAWLEF